MELYDSPQDVSASVCGEDVGEPRLAGGAEPPEGGPVARDGVGEEEEDAAGGDLQRAGGVVAFVLEVEQVLAELLLGDLIGRLVEVGGEPPDDAEVSPLSSLSEPGELKILAHALAERSGHAGGLSKRGEDERSTVWKALCCGPGRKSPGAKRCADDSNEPAHHEARRKAATPPAA